MSNINAANETFFTNATTTTMRNNGLDTPEPRMGLERVKAVPFMDIYTIKIGHNGAEVYADKNTLIASVGRMYGLSVLTAYRGKGIGEEMIYEWLMQNRDFQASTVTARTAGGNRVYVAAWAKYKAAVEAENVQP